MPKAKSNPEQVHPGSPCAETSSEGPTFRETAGDFEDVEHGCPLKSIVLFCLFLLLDLSGPSLDV